MRWAPSVVQPLAITNKNINRPSSDFGKKELHSSGLSKLHKMRSVKVRLAGGEALEAWVAGALERVKTAEQLAVGESSSGRHQES